MTVSTMAQLAGRLDACAEQLAGVGRVLPALEMGPPVPGAGLPGRFDLELRRQWAAVLGARSSEVAAVGAGMAGLAEAVRTSDEQYSDVDHAAARRIARER